MSQSMTTHAEAPPGLDLEALSAWLSPRVGGLEGPLGAELIAGGKSNLTYLVADESRRWVVRRPPLGHVLASAHDMSREYRMLSALQETDVPVPGTVAYCEDQAVLGADFYVMEYVEGTVYRQASQLLPLGPERVRSISCDLVDTLAALHAVDPAAVGLADFGRAEGFLARQVRRWGQQLDSSYSRELAGATELRRQLADRVPTESSAGIVHGDYSISNTLIADSHVAAVLDWEMATIGDPLTDLALLAVYHRLSAIEPGGTVVADASNAPGFLTEVEIIDRYTKASSRDLSNFGFYLALAAFKLATITEGIHFRYLQGQTVGDGFDDMGEIVPPLLEMGLEYLASAS